MLRVCVVAVLLALAPPDAGGDPASRVSFTLPPDGLIEVPVRVRGIPVTFALDTAADMSAVSTRLAARLDLSTDQLRGRTFASDVDLQLPGLTLPHQRMAILPFTQNGIAIDGVIGTDLCERFVVEIDFDARRLSFWQPSAFRPRRNLIAIAMGRIGRVPFVGAKVRLPGIEVPVDARLVLGTGVRQALLLRYPFANDHGLLDLTQRDATTPVTLDQRSLETVRVPGVQLMVARWSMDTSDARAFREPAVSRVLGDSDGVIGLSVLRRFTIFMDYPHDRVLLRPGRKSGLSVRK